MPIPAKTSIRDRRTRQPTRLPAVAPKHHSGSVRTPTGQSRAGDRTADDETGRNGWPFGSDLSRSGAGVCAPHPPPVSTHA